MKHEPLQETSIRRAIAASLLVWLALLHGASWISASIVAGAAPKTCCHTKGSCCCKNSPRNGSSFGPGWAARPDCPQHCQVQPGIFFHGHLLPCRGKTVWDIAAPDEVPGVAPQTRSASTSYLAFLYQRPPPSS